MKYEGVDFSNITIRRLWKIRLLEKVGCHQLQGRIGGERNLGRGRAPLVAISDRKEQRTN